MAKKRKKTNEQKVSRGKIRMVASILMVTVSLCCIVATGVFVHQTIERITVNAFKLTEEDRESVETIELELLSELEKKIKAKNALDVPREGRLRNPFSERLPIDPPVPLKTDEVQTPVDARPVQ